MRVPTFLLTAALLTACGSSDAPSTSGSTDSGPAQRDTLVIAYQSDIGNLISVVSESAADSDILTNISEPLVDSDFDCSLKKLPGIAKEWSWSEDGKVLSMTLRDDITFQDGEKLTAEDVKFTYDLVADPNVASARIAYIDRMVEGKRPLVLDDTHIEWHFTEAYDRDTQAAHASAVSILPSHVLESADRKTLRGHPLGKDPLASGPWKLSVYEPNTRIVLEPNDNYTGPEDRIPHLKRVVFKIIPEYSTRLLELENGDVDLMQSILVADYDRLRKEHDDLRFVRRGWRSMDYVGWNLQNPKFQDARVRKALAMAVDIDEMIGKLLTSEDGEAFAKRSVGTITPALCGVHNDDITPLPYEATEAKALFAEAGWTDSDGDGWLDKDGERFEFVLTTNTGNKRRADVAILLQAYLKQVGVKVDIEQQESNTFFENLRKKDYEAALAGWAAGLFVDPSGIWHSDVTCAAEGEEGYDPSCKPRKYEFNFVSYDNDRVDELIDTGLKTPRPEEAAPIWRELQQVIYDDQPYMFLWWMDEIVGVHERFEDVRIDVLSPIHDLHDWKVPEDKVKYKR